MTFIRAKACRPSTTTPLLNCSWQSAQRVDARTTDASRQRSRRSVTPVEDLRTPRAFGAWLQIGDERFNSTEIERLYEALRKPE